MESVQLSVLRADQGQMGDEFFGNKMVGPKNVI